MRLQTIFPKRVLGLALAAGFGFSLTLRAGEPTAKELMTKSDCFTCHSFDTKIVGPAYKDVAKRYTKEPDSKIIPVLVKKIKEGGSGNWGSIPMAPHPSLSDADLTKIVRYILGREEKPAAKAEAKSEKKGKATVEKSSKKTKKASKHAIKKATPEATPHADATDQAQPTPANN